MSYAPYIKEIGRGMNSSRELPPQDAQRLYAAMLDGGVPISNWARSCWHYG